MKKNRCPIIKGFMLIMLLCSFGLTGCLGNDIENDLEEAEEDRQLSLVAEYAAGILLKYDKNHTNGLTVAPPLPPSMDEPADKPPMEEPMPPAGENMGTGEGPGEYSDEGETVEISAEPVEGEEAVNSGTIAEALSVPEFDITYTGYEICSSYPDSAVSDNSMLFSLQSQEGEKLLILHFDLYNGTGQDMECSLINNEAKIRLLVNDEERLNQQMTILMNDLKSFDDTVPAGSGVDTVLVFYIADDYVDNIENLTLLIVGSDGEYRFEL